ncbi:MAG: leucyl aminopeptidase [Candidatus Dadabacteria bacterium]|nr:MAG: leucyl aminopeptidase [Candidatus Dadabacteria bacterium]
MRITTKKLSVAASKADLLIIVTTPKEMESSKAPRNDAAAFSIRDFERTYPGTLRILKKTAFKADSMSSALVSIGTQKNFLAAIAIGWNYDEKKLDDFTSFERYRMLGNAVVTKAQEYKARSVIISAPALDFKNKENAEAFIEGLALGSYSFKRYKKTKSTGKYPASITIVSGKRFPAEASRRALAMTSGTLLARDLVNTPAADLTPRIFSRICRQIARKSSLRCTVYDQNRLKKMKAGALLSVAKGSKEPAMLVKLVYRPRSKVRKTVSLVGKGITFDTGGYSLKPGSGMQTMKCDMSGAAAVVGAMQAIARLKPAVEVRGYIALAENMVNGNATRPGDIVKAMNGKTIEVLNTDAEGRLVLADALCLAERDKCDVIIDLATLTGACMVALGTDYSGLFTKDDRLAEKLIRAGTLSGEHLWRMPLPARYAKQLKSTVADLKNIGGRWGGAITAALFLKEFVTKTPWAHLDIAGPAFNEGSRQHYIHPGGVGFGVRTLVRYVTGL